MSFAVPGRLWLLVCGVVLVIGYVIAQVRRRRVARRFADADLLPRLVSARVGLWRHAVAALFVTAVSVALVGAAQPTIPGEQERERATIVVAIDTSDSMNADDVRPSRLDAAVAAARSFVADLPSTFDVGLVTAGANPSIVVPPTRDHGAVIGALGTLETGPGTALGDAIFTSLSAIPTVAGAGSPSGSGGDGDDGTTGPAATIVLLSDGVTTTGRPDEVAVEAASAAGVSVSTIAFGTDDATVRSQGQVVEVPVDSTALEAIAEGTDGRFFEAASRSELEAIYQEVDTELAVEAIDVDIAEWFAGIALALALLAVTVSIVTTGRVAVA